MPNPKPGVLMAWATNPSPGSLLQPPSTLTTNGYSFNSKPAYNHFNWLLNNIGQWLAYLDTLDQNFLSQSDASTTYATQSSLATTNGNVTSLSNTVSTINQNYLSQSSASTTYATQSSLSATNGNVANLSSSLSATNSNATSLSNTVSTINQNYLSQSSASTTYATQSSLSATNSNATSLSDTVSTINQNYLSQTGAATTYATLSSLATTNGNVSSLSSTVSTIDQNYLSQSTAASTYAPAANAQHGSTSADAGLTAGQSGNTLTENLWAPAAGTYLINWTILLSSPNGAISLGTYLMTNPANSSTYTRLSAKAFVEATGSVFNVVVSGSYIATLAKGDLIYIAGDNTGGETIDILTGSYISAIRIA